MKLHGRQKTRLIDCTPQAGLGPRSALYQQLPLGDGRFRSETLLARHDLRFRCETSGRKDTPERHWQERAGTAGAEETPRCCHRGVRIPGGGFAAKPMVRPLP